ncbi:gamma-glutamyltransferase [Elioraea rosea]|uniref:gamma-glutamyltransferase n=1 Tax=Elioraea rosea TaxID=2492390 RepID=UPI001182CC81|nr:gamma-glutamyltransferase [Elioraea rosea]
MAISHQTQNWVVAKPAAHGRKGMVASQVKAAAEAGVAMLDAGGTALDAAAATAFALAALEPWNSGLGGIGFALVHRAGAAQAEVIDFGPVSPAGLKPKLFPIVEGVSEHLFAWPNVEGEKNVHGPLSFCIPSAPAGYAALHARGGRLPWKDVLAPAIALAKGGLPADWFGAMKIASSAVDLRRYPESARIYLPDGLPPTPPYVGPAKRLILGRLPDTLARIAEAGIDDFYKGDIAASIASDVAAMGGVLSAADLAGCATRTTASSQHPWHGRVIQGAGGLTAAPTMQRVLDQMAAHGFGKEPDAAFFTAFAAAMQKAYAERLAGLGDTTDANPRAAEACTTHFTVVDAEGTMVSVTTTLLSSMGSRTTLPGTGIMMNNGVFWFDPRPGQANSIGPSKRPLCNMSPVIVTENGRPIITAGASGGRRILASVLQMLMFVLDYGMEPERAAHHPRVDVSGPDTVTADKRLSPSILSALTGRFRTELVEHTVLPVNFACPNLIRREADGSLTGISDVMSPWSGAVAQA